MDAAHAASSYGLLVLVAPDGRAFGPADLLSLSEAAELRGGHPAYLRRKCLDSPGWGTKIGRNWAVSAARAVEQNERSGPKPG